MKKLIVFLSFIFPLISFSQQTYYSNFNCYTIAVGKNASENGSVIIGHNEDDWGNLIINIFKVPAKNNQQNDSITLLNGTKLKQTKHNFSYLWFETTNQKFGDYYLNENGVSICSNACQSKEDTAKGNIGFYLRCIIAERANNAKQGVRIAGKIISEIGYESSGRTYCIADNNQIWMLSIVKGRHWIAQRVPDDSVTIIPNYYIIENINLNDTNNFLASSDIIEYAIKRDWYNPKVDGQFNFKKVYGNTENLYSIVNIPRHWSGINFLSDKKYNYGSDLPFSFTPNKKINTADIEKVLSSHYENTDFETNYKLHKNPHQKITHPICNTSTKFSIVKEYAKNKNIVWWAPLNPCINPYIPIYLTTKTIPSMYQSCSLNNALKKHFNVLQNTFEANSKHAFSVFNKYNSFINEDYVNRIELSKNWQNQFSLKIDSLLKINKNSSNISNSILELLYNEESKLIK